jgi:hypothetical protein
MSLNLSHKPASLRAPTRPKTPTDASRVLMNVDKILPGLQFYLFIFHVIFIIQRETAKCYSKRIGFLFKNVERERFTRGQTVI